MLILRGPPLGKRTGTSKLSSESVASTPDAVKSSPALSESELSVVFVRCIVFFFITNGFSESDGSELEVCMMALSLTDRLNTLMAMLFELERERVLGQL